MGLQMNFEEVTDQGNGIKSRAEDVTTLQNWLNTVVTEQLPSLWQGSGYEGFADRVAELQPSFNAMRQLIEDIGNGVIKNAQEYDAFDKSVAAANRGG